MEEDIIIPKDVYLEVTSGIDKGMKFLVENKTITIGRNETCDMKLSDEYVSNFSLEWTIHKQTQLDTVDSDESRRTFQQRIGFTADEIGDRLVLDAGVGMGRYSDVALSSPRA